MPQNKAIDIDKINSYEYKLAIFTDRADFIDHLNEKDVDKLLELRAFNKDGELRVYRSSVDSNFRCRNSLDYADENFFDETHYLDIDSERNDENDNAVKFTTGGGSYHLPVDKTMIVIRYYYKYDDNGIARKYDWRLVDFADEEDVRCHQSKEDQ